MFAWQATVQDEAGNAVPLPVVTVYEGGGGELADIYGEDGTPLENPFTGTMEGFVQFWAEPGKYRVSGVSGSGETQEWHIEGGGVELGLDALTAFETRADMVAALDSLSGSQGGRVVWAGGLAYIRDSGSDDIPDLPGWKPVVEVTPQHFGAVGDGVADDTDPVAGAIQQAAEAGLVGLPDGVFVTYRDNPSSGGTSPQDWALNPDAAELIKGTGVNSVLKSQVPNNNITMRYGLLPIGDREPDIVGGGIEGVIFDGGFDASDPATHPGWTDEGNMPLWVSGVQDWTIRNVNSINSPDYGIGFQNGRHKRLRIRDVFIDNAMNDAIDVKNNYNRGRDNSMMGVWAERFGRAGNEAFAYAGIDLMEPRWVASHIWATGWGDMGDTVSGIRFKQGEGDDPRGLGAFKAVLTGFHVEALEGAGRPDNRGVDVRHRQVIVGAGTVDGCHIGALFEQERGIAFGLNLHGKGPTVAGGTGILSQNSTNPTNGDDLVTFGSHIQNFQYGVRSNTNRTIHFGHVLKDNNKSVRTDGNDNAVLAISTGHSGPSPVIDNGERNWIGLWESGTLNVYRSGVVRYSFGDIIESRAAGGSLVGRYSAIDNAGWAELTVPETSTGLWMHNTNGVFAWARNGEEILRLNTGNATFNVPVRLRAFGVNGLPSDTATGSIIYVPNGDAGQPCLAVFDGTDWRRVSLGEALI